MMQYETALMLWWAVGWGGWIDCRMLATMRGCSLRGARDVLASATRRGWLRCHYVNSRCALYRVTVAGRMMASIKLEMPFLARLQPFNARKVDGEFAPPTGWLHAREASIATIRLAKIILPDYDIEPHWVFPMCQLRVAKGQKTPDAILVGIDFCYAHEYERSRKPGREKKNHATWETLERYIFDVSAGAVRFGDNLVTNVIITPNERHADELDRHLRKNCGDKATELYEIMEWGWYVGGVLDWRKAEPRTTRK